jgi:hypothetical protein
MHEKKLTQRLKQLSTASRLKKTWSLLDCSSQTTGGGVRKHTADMHEDMAEAIAIVGRRKLETAGGATGRSGIYVLNASSMVVATGIGKLAVCRLPRSFLGLAKMCSLGVLLPC